MAARIGILVVSDSRHQRSRPDESGPAAKAALNQAGYEDTHVEIVPDEIPKIKKGVVDLAKTCRAVITIGGTGFSPRDVTPEATATLLDKRADSIAELLRQRGLEQTHLSHLSRGIAGVYGDCFVVNLPGKPEAVTQGIEVLAPLLERILDALAAS